MVCGHRTYTYQRFLSCDNISQKAPRLCPPVPMCIDSDTSRYNHDCDCVSLPLPAAVGWIQRQEWEVAVPGTYGSTQAAAHDAETAPGNPNITGDGVRRVF